MRLVVHVFRRISWTLGSSSAVVTVRYLGLPLIFGNLLERTKTRAPKGPTSPPYAVLRIKIRFRSWGRSRCFKSCGLRDRFSSTKKLIFAFWTCITKSSMNLQHFCHSSQQEPTNHLLSAPVAGKRIHRQFFELWKLRRKTVCCFYSTWFILRTSYEAR